MKRKVSIFALILISVGFLAGQGLSARKRVIKVQGHPHESLTTLHGGKEDATAKTRAVTGSTANINLADIQCWAGGLDPTITSQYIDSAVLLVKWTQIPEEYTADSILIWGYRWNTISISIDPATGERDTFQAAPKYTIDMIRAVANADCRFSVLLQNSSAAGFTAGGFGYNIDDENTYRVHLRFDAAGAAADSRIKFHYTGSPNCTVGQGVIPYNVSDQTTEAFKRAGVPPANVDNGTGIIRHPFDADYGYPAYDFDYWVRFPWPIAMPHYWQAGWFNGYWAFYTKNQLNGNFIYSNDGIGVRQLGNHYVDGFVFEGDPTAWPPEHDMSGNYTPSPHTCNCGCSN
jgi:hypothetical protein